MARSACILVLLAALAGCQARPQDAKHHNGLQEQIVGGHDASITDLPWQASLRSDGQHICGASILNTRWILTAAHCLPGISNPSIRVGSSSVSLGGRVYSVAFVFGHPDYVPSTHQNDVALGFVASDIQLNANVQPVRLVNAGSPPPAGTKLTVSGWGDLYSDGDSPDRLQSVDVPVVNHNTCQRNYARQGALVDDSMLCAGTGGKDSCQGDSGGPLIASSSGVQVGIVSWGIGCAVQGLPGVYSDLSNPRLRSFVQTYTGV